MNRTCCIVAAAVFALSAPSWAAGKDLLLDHMTGHWVLTGTIEGKKTVHDVTAEWIMQGTYVRLSEIARKRDASGNPEYEAQVLIAYDAAKLRYVCFWYDTEGIAAPDAQGGVAVRRGNTLPFLFKTPQGNFHTTFLYDAKADNWSWSMDGEVNGKLQPFARVTLTRH